MFTMVKSKPDCTDEKVKTLEDKKKQEELQLQTELTEKKNTRI